MSHVQVGRSTVISKNVCGVKVFFSIEEARTPRSYLDRPWLKRQCEKSVQAPVLRCHCPEQIFFIFFAPDRCISWPGTPTVPNFYLLQRVRGFALRKDLEDFRGETQLCRVTIRPADPDGCEEGLCASSGFNFIAGVHVFLGRDTSIHSFYSPWGVNRCLGDEHLDSNAT